jgi:cellulose synthase/poly-beta-1,6-N-acetylglucosamine synthase-like glycosyltransferase
MTDISVIIPVLRESEPLWKILKFMKSQKVDKEIIVTATTPTERFLAEARRVKGVRFFFNKLGTGKAVAVNSAVRKSSGKVLLFLDDDIRIPNDPRFLGKLIEKAKRVDVIDLKKEVIQDGSFLAKMGYYEYMAMGFSAWVISRSSGKCPAVCGSGFAMRRDMFEKLKGFRRVVAEDIDMAIRAYLAGARFEYAKDVAIRNMVHPEWRKWFRQRRKWVIGQGLWQKDWGRELAAISLKNPRLSFMSIFILDSSIFMLAVAAIVAAIPSMQASWAFNLLKFIAIWGAGFGITAAAFKLFARIAKFKFRIWDFFAYYFVYSLLYSAMQIVGNVQVSVFKRKKAEGWIV